MSELHRSARADQPLPPAPAPPAEGENPSTRITVRDLTSIAAMVVDLVPQCDHASIIVTPRRGIDIVGASDETARAAAERMLSWGEGRAPEALRTADTIDGVDLAGSSGWPAAAQALRDEVGVGGMLGRRLLTDDRRLGFLALYSDEPGALATVDPRHLETLTNLVGGWVVAHESAAKVGQLQRAMANARLMGRAIGILMVERGLLSDEAIEYLKRTSNRLNVRVHDIAGNVVRGHEARVGSRRVGSSALTVPAEPATPAPGAAGRSPLPDRPSDRPAAAPPAPPGDARRPPVPGPRP